MLPASDRRIARQTLWMGAILVVQILGSLAQVSLSARTLGLEGFGVLSIIIAVTSLIHGLVSIPGGSAVTTFVTGSVAEGRPEEASRILRFTLAVSAGLSLVAYALIAALTLTASSLVGIDEAYTGAVLLYGVVGILMATQTETLAVLRLADRVSLNLAITTAGTLTRVALLAVAWLTEGGLTEVILAYVAGAAVDGVGMFAAAAIFTGRVGMTGFLSSLSLKVPPNVIQFQTGTFGKTTIGALTQHLDSILVAQFAGAADVGLYRAARRIIDIARRPFQPIVNGVQVEYSRQWHARQGANLRRISLRFTLLSIILSTVGFGLLAMFHGIVIRFILGPDFSSAGPLLLIMILGSFFATSISALSVLPEVTGRIWPSVVALTGAFVAFLAVILWLMPWYGVAGAAWANTTYFMVYTAVIIPFIIQVLRQSYRNNAASAAPKHHKSAKEFYLNPQVYKQYQTKFKRGRSRLEDHIVNELIQILFARYLNKDQNILEIGAYSGRITRKLALYSDNITVSDISPEILNKFRYPKMVLDLRTSPDKIIDNQAFDAIISIGNQVSICGDIINAISIFTKLLNPGGILIFDIWNESLPEKYDPAYPIEKSSKRKVQEILRESGFELREYRSLSRLPFVFPRAFSILFHKANNSILFNLLLRLERLIFRIGLFEGRELSQIFIATKLHDPSGKPLND